MEYYQTVGLFFVQINQFIFSLLHVQVCLSNIGSLTLMPMQLITLRDRTHQSYMRFISASMADKAKKKIESWY